MRDATGFPFLAEGIEEIGELALGQSIHQISRALSLAGHSHIQRSLAHEGEPTTGLVELHRGDADIEYHAVDRALGELIQLRKGALYELETTRKFACQRIRE